AVAHLVGTSRRRAHRSDRGLVAARSLPADAERDARGRLLDLYQPEAQAVRARGDQSVLAEAAHRHRARRGQAPVVQPDEADDGAGYWFAGPGDSGGCPGI